MMNNNNNKIAFVMIFLKRMECNGRKRKTERNMKCNDHQQQQHGMEKKKGIYIKPKRKKGYYRKGNVLK